MLPLLVLVVAPALGLWMDKHPRSQRGYWRGAAVGLILAVAIAAAAGLAVWKNPGMLLCLVVPFVLCAGGVCALAGAVLGGLTEVQERGSAAAAVGVVTGTGLLIGGVPAYFEWSRSQGMDYTGLAFLWCLAALLAGAELGLLASLAHVSRAAYREPEPPPQPPRRCRRCGRTLVAGTPFCVECGAATR